ncbi:MAG: aminotransferase, partial [Eubacteriales bacterium]|nr:aminotransferase [Eubacteriales bacterium]
ADRIMEEELHDLDICRWTRPSGGYFISLEVFPGTARQVVSLAKGCGVALTPAGSTWPNGVDPHDSSIRLAPSFPPLDELEQAMQVLTVCIRLAALRHLTDRVS